MCTVHSAPYRATQKSSEMRNSEVRKCPILLDIRAHIIILFSWVIGAARGNLIDFIKFGEQYSMNIFNDYGCSLLDSAR